MKFYDEDKFKDLNKTWQKALKKSGFNDIEKPDGNLKVWTSFKKFHKNGQHARVWYNSKELYYRLASQFLHEHKFETKLEKTVWEYHSNGYSFEKITKLIKKPNGRARRIIEKLRDVMKKTIEVNEDDGS